MSSGSLLLEELAELLVHCTEPRGAFALEMGILRELNSPQFSGWHQKAFRVVEELAS